jgi:Holliday junction resolvase RusA-like endonuclease
MSDLSVEVPGLPLPQGSKKIGTYKVAGIIRRSIIDNNPRLAQWRMQITNYTRQAMADATVAFPIEGPISVDITFFMPRPQSHYGTGKNERILKPSAPDLPTHAPDLDKLVRSILDGCTDAGTWHDDAQVVNIWAIKMYAEDRGPGVHFSVRHV